MKHVHASHPGNPQKFDMDQRQDTIAEPMQELRLKTGINRFGKRKMTEHISFKNSRSILELLWPIVLSLAVGAFSAYMQSDSIQYWYPLLNKPPLTPPRIVFPIVWTVLYIMTGLSMGLVLQRKNQRKRLLLMLFLFQLFLVLPFFRLPEPAKRSYLYRRSALERHLVRHPGVACLQNCVLSVLAVFRLALFRHIPESLHLHV